MMAGTSGSTSSGESGVGERDSDELSASVSEGLRTGGGTCFLREKEADRTICEGNEEERDTGGCERKEHLHMRSHFDLNAGAWHTHVAPCEVRDGTHAGAAGGRRHLAHDATGRLSRRFFDLILDRGRIRWGTTRAA